MEPDKVDKSSKIKKPGKQHNKITSGGVVASEVSEDSSVEKAPRTYGGKGNSKSEEELEKARQVRQARNRNSARAFRKRKQNDIEATREAAKRCDAEILELKERLRVVRGKNVELEGKVREKRKRDGPSGSGAGDRVVQNKNPRETS
mmetsp:Transcript_32511/g.77653  ORF Transcript_32511/g.77653 Transcript_32511/m.77653 type:complete len:147 (+) Transcript_32511:192-632(+)